MDKFNYECEKKGISDIDINKGYTYFAVSVWISILGIIYNIAYIVHMIIEKNIHGLINSVIILGILSSLYFALSVRAHVYRTRSFEDKKGFLKSFNTIFPSIRWKENN